VRHEDLEDLAALAWNQREIEDASRDAARFIGSLTAVDGAVVLTDKLIQATAPLNTEGADTIETVEE